MKFMHYFERRIMSMFQHKLILSHDIHLLHLQILSLQRQHINYTLVITRLISDYKTRCTVWQ